MKAFLLLAPLLTGCLAALGSYTAPSSICSKRNDFPYRVEVFLQDDEGHSQWMGLADPGNQFCGTWVLPGQKGRWGFAPLDGPVRWERVWFQAWGLR